MLQFSHILELHLLTNLSLRITQTLVQYYSVHKTELLIGAVPFTIFSCRLDFEFHFFWNKLEYKDKKFEK